MFLARVRKPENIDNEFNKALELDQRRYTEERNRIQLKINRAKTVKERREAEAMKYRLEREDKAAELQGKKNAAEIKRKSNALNLMERERERIQQTRQEKAEKNANAQRKINAARANRRGARAEQLAEAQKAENAARANRRGARAQQLAEAQKAENKARANRRAAIANRKGEQAKQLAEAQKAENKTNRNKRVANANRRGAAAIEEAGQGKEVNKARIGEQAKVNIDVNKARIVGGKNARITVNRAKIEVNKNAQIKMNAANATKRGAQANREKAKAVVNMNAQKRINAAAATKKGARANTKKDKALTRSFNDRMKLKRKSLTNALAKLSQLTNKEREGYVSQVTLNGNINTILTEARGVDRKRLNDKMLIAKKQGNLNKLKELQRLKKERQELKPLNKPPGGGNNTPKPPGGGNNTPKPPGGGNNTPGKPNNKLKMALAMIQSQKAKQRAKGKLSSNERSKLQDEKKNNNAWNETRAKQEFNKLNNKPKSKLSFRGAGKLVAAELKMQEKNAALIGLNRNMKRTQEAQERTQKTLEKVAGNKAKVNDRLRKSRAKIKELKLNKKNSQTQPEGGNNNTENLVKTFTKDIQEKLATIKKLKRNKIVNKVVIKNLKQQVNKLTVRSQKLKKRVETGNAELKQAFENAMRWATHYKEEVNRIQPVMNSALEQIVDSAEPSQTQQKKNINNRFKRDARQQLLNKIKNLNQKVQNSFIQRIPKANTWPKIQEIRNQINEALKNKQKANRPIQTNPVYAQTNAAGANAANTAGASAAGANNKKLEEERKRINKKARTPGYVPGIGIGKWGTAIKTANMTRLEELDTELNNRKAFSNEIKKMNNIGMKEKGRYLQNIWKYNQTINIVKEAIEANKKRLEADKKREEGAMERRKQLAKNKIIQDVKKKQKHAKNTVNKMPLKNNNKTVLLRKLNEITANNNKITQNTVREIQTIRQSAQRKSANFIREKAAREKNEKAKKKEAEKKAAQEAKAAKEKAAQEAKEKAAQEAKAAKEKANAEQKAAQEAKAAQEKAAQAAKARFQGAVKKIKQNQVMNKVKTAARIATDQKKLSEATGTERRKLARQQSAATGRNKGKNATAAAGLLKKTRNKQFAEKGISAAAAKKAENKRNEAAAKKQKKRNEVQKALNAQQAKAKALKAKKEQEALQRKQNTNRKVAAATKIQAGFRGMRNRKAVKKQRRALKRIQNTSGFKGKPANPLGRRG